MKQEKFKKLVERSKRRIGRPTKYRKAYCDIIINEMALGFSKTAACAVLEVGVDTCNDWAKRHPEFKEALAIAKSLRLRYLEEQFLAAPNGSEVTKLVWALKNTNTDEWMDRRELDMKSSDGTMTPPERVVLRGIAKNGDS